MFIQPNLRSLPSVRMGTLNALYRKQVEALHNYVRIRKLQHISYSELMALAQNGRMVKRLLLDNTADLTGPNGRPIAAFYLLDNHVAAYVAVSTTQTKVLTLSAEAVSQLPTSIVENTHGEN